MTISQKEEFAREAYRVYNDNVRPIETVIGSDDVMRVVGGGHNDEIDAFRHAYVSARFAIEYGEAVSNILGIANEVIHQNPSNETNMDLWNNSIGRQYANQASNKDQLANLLIGALNRNELITTLNNSQEQRQYSDALYDDFSNAGYAAFGVTKANAGELNNFTPDNSALNLTINTSPAKSPTQNNNITQNGGIIGDGDWTLEAPILRLNGDGAKNVLPYGIASDSYRPGNTMLAANVEFNTELRVDFARLDSLAAQMNNVGNSAAQLSQLNLQLQNPMANIGNNFINARTLQNIDPVVLDLNGDGVKLTSYNESQVTFDVDNDGKQERTGWVSSADGILVDDKNHDGVINDITETISEYYSLTDAQWIAAQTLSARNDANPFVRDADGKYSSDGLAALRKLDSNHDGKFSSADAKWNDLKVWQDVNGDGFMIKLFRIIVSVLIFLTCAMTAYANGGYSYKTGCKYSTSLNTGCVGSVGYIYITPWQESEKKNKDLTCKSSVFMKRNQKKPDISYPLRNLPKVGSIVEPGSFLIFYQDLEQIKRQYEFCDKEVDELYKIVDLKRTPFKTEAERRMCGISGCLSRMSKYNNINGEEDTLMPGNRLEIISYENLKEGLFAKIKVTK